MRKAILVIDMPEDCGDCPVMKFINGHFTCVLKNTKCGDTRKPDWCPLRQIPEKKETICYENDSWCAVEEKTKNAGWNACIDAIIEN